jgi:hypothetical protein
MRTPTQILKTLPLILLGAGMLAALMLSMISAPAAASPLYQSTALPLPTAGADGRILYTVVAGDSQWLIAGKFNIPIEQLRILNGWTADQVLFEGQTVILGISGEEPTPTSGPTSEVIATNTPEAAPGTGAICVLLFDDVNGDALREDTEFGIAAGAASVSERTGLASRTGDTVAQTDEDGLPVATCFEDLPGGEYTVSVAAPQGYNPTTAQSATIQLAPGDQTSLNFGAQAGGSSGLNLLSPEEGGPPSPLMGLLGIVLLIGGAGLGVYSWQLSRRRF